MDHPFFLAAVIVAFVTFGVALAYVDRIAGRRPDVHPAE
jgi:hypothetical protein